MAVVCVEGEGGGAPPCCSRWSVPHTRSRSYTRLPHVQIPKKIPVGMGEVAAKAGGLLRRSTTSRSK